MGSLSHEKYNQLITEKCLAAITQAQNYVNAFNQRNLTSLLETPTEWEINRSKGTVTVNVKIDATTLATTGLLFLAQGHPDYLAPKVTRAIIQDSGWCIPAYQYFGQQVQNEIDTQLAPNSSNFSSLLLPVTIDLKSPSYVNLLSPSLQNANLFLNLDLEFGLIK